MVMMCFWAVLEGVVSLTVFLMRASDVKKLAISGTSMKLVLRVGEGRGNKRQSQAVRNVAWSFSGEKSELRRRFKNPESRAGRFSKRLHHPLHARFALVLFSKVPEATGRLL